MSLGEFFLILTIFLGATGTFGLSWYVLRKNPKAKLNRWFAAFGFSVGFWVLTNFLLQLTKSLFWFRATFASAAFIIPTVINLFFAVDDRKVSRKINFILAGSALFFATLSMTSLVAKDIKSVFFGYEGRLGELFWLWGVYEGGGLLFAFSFLFWRYLKAKGEKKIRIGYFLLGVVIPCFWALIVSIFLPMFFNIKTLSNLDSPLSILMISTMAYAIVKHRLMGIRVFFLKALSSAIAIAGLAGFLAGLILIGVRLFPLYGTRAMWPIAFLGGVIIFVIGRSFFMRTKELEEIKTTLEIRVKARTRELEELNRQLEELNKTLEEKVKQRTKELQERVNELERFHRLTVGRELKMRELKEEIKKLRKSLEEKKEKG